MILYLDSDFNIVEQDRAVFAVVVEDEGLPVFVDVASPSTQLSRKENESEAQAEPALLSPTELSGRGEGKKYGRFVTIDGRPVFIGGPGSGAGGTSVGGTSGVLPSAKYVEDNENASSLNDGQDFMRSDVNMDPPNQYFPEGTFSFDTRAKIKDEIIRKLSEDSGIDYETVNAIVGTWANSSNDSSVDSLAIQQEAAKMFGSSLSEWQQEKIASIGSEGGRTFNGEVWVSVPAGSIEPIIATRPQIRTVLNAMYENTQKELVAAGFPEYVTLRRGVSNTIGDIGSVAQVYENALSSFTSDRQTAWDFGFEGSIIEMQVPRSRIISTARTGFGCLTEYEFVVIGNNRGGGDQALIVDNEAP